MSSEKKPKSGEWWENETGLRCHIVGIRADGRTVVESKRSGMICMQLHATNWQRLDGCDSYEWVKPDWVEITDPDHVLRRGVDHYQRQQTLKWLSVSDLTGCTVRELGCKVRCLRKNLPFPQWVSREEGNGGFYVEDTE